MKTILRFSIMLAICAVALYAMAMDIQINYFGYDADSVMVSVTRQGGTPAFFGTISRDGETVAWFTPNDTNPHYYQVAVPTGRANIVVRVYDANGVVERSMTVFTGAPR